MTSGPSPALPPELERRGRTLRTKIGELMARGVPTGTGPDAAAPEVEELALEVFRFQVEAVPAYGAFVRGRGGPDAVRHWSEIPPVPTRAFRELPLVAGDPDRVEAVFRTSGTTGGGDARGEHRVRDLSLYREALLPNARAHLGGREGLRVLALLPSPDARPESSLAHMAGVLAREWDPEGGAFLLDASWQPAWKALGRALDEGAAGERSVLLLGTAFAFVHLLDRAAEERRRWSLPPGSRIMETGGFKGRSREVERTELYRGLEDTLAVPASRIVNEYGMTEMLSQFYEPVLRGDASRVLAAPPWVRTRVLDPERLEPVPAGATGLLCHLDLANLYSVSAILTEDLGVAAPGGFRVLGRIPGAEPRGCSLSMEELLAAGEGRGR